MFQEEEPVGQKLDNAIARLQQERQSRLEAIAEIDEVFQRLGIALEPKRRRGRPPGRTKGAKSQARGRMSKKRAGKRAKRTGRRATMGTTTPKKRGPHAHSASGPESVLEFVKQRGKQGAATSEIVQHWEADGRKTGVYVVIGKLVREKRLRKHAMEGRGSRYTAA